MCRLKGRFMRLMTAPHQIVVLQDTNLRIPSATLNAQGTIGNQSSLQLNVVANDLHEAYCRGLFVRSSNSVAGNFRSSATLNALVRGSIQSPAIAAELHAQNVQVVGKRVEIGKFPDERDSLSIFGAEWIVDQRPSRTRNSNRQHRAGRLVLQAVEPDRGLSRRATDEHC